MIEAELVRGSLRRWPWQSMWEGACQNVLNDKEVERILQSSGNE
jgi:hypothetical protein